MNWFRKSDYHIESDGERKFYVAKVFMDGVAYYELWEKGEMLGIYNSAKEAMLASEGRG